MCETENTDIIINGVILDYNEQWRRNTVIDVFMGDDALKCDLEDRDYIYDWSSLVPVIEKIQKIDQVLANDYFSSDGWYFFITKFSEPKQSCFAQQIDTKIHAAYFAVTEFLKWYNENN